MTSKQEKKWTGQAVAIALPIFNLKVFVEPFVEIPVYKVSLRLLTISKSSAWYHLFDANNNVLASVTVAACAAVYAKYSPSAVIALANTFLDELPEWLVLY